MVVVGLALQVLAAGITDPITVVAIIGAASTLLSAAFAAWAGVKQRRTEDVKLGYEAMREALNNYRNDNTDLRNRITIAEQRILDLTAKVGECEADKAVLNVKVAQQTDRIAELERRASGGAYP